MEETQSSSDRKVSWIEWFCNQPENLFFCKVNKSYIKDKFNLYDLNNLFESDSSYKEALKIILDEATIRRTSAASSQENAEMLYGMIHSRYIKCAAGLEAMRRKYVRGDFGTCPRHGCRDQLAIPIGLSEEAGEDEVKIFCTKCQNVYNCLTESLDGAYFGPTFPHVFFMTYDALVPEPLSPSDAYQPRVYGFKVHPSSSSLPSSKNVVSESSGESSGDGEFNISNIKAHNPVVQHVKVSASLSSLAHPRETGVINKKRLSGSSEVQRGNVDVEIAGDNMKEETATGDIDEADRKRVKREE